MTAKRSSHSIESGRAARHWHWHWYLFIMIVRTEQLMARLMEMWHWSGKWVQYDANLGVGQYAKVINGRDMEIATESRDPPATDRFNEPSAVRRNWEYYEPKYPAAMCACASSDAKLAKFRMDATTLRHQSRRTLNVGLFPLLKL